MLQYVTQRLLQSIVVLFGVTTLVFSLLHLAPGDPVLMMLPDGATQEQIDHLRSRLGLDRPLIEQFVSFLDRAVRGDLGTSLYHRQPALQVVLRYFPSTALLASAALLLTVAIGVPLGIISALKRDSFVDYLAMGFAVLGQAVPPFWLGIMLILIFSVNLGWFPTYGSGTWRHVILPAVTLGAYLMALITRLTRSGLLEVLNTDYVRTARAKGLRFRQVIWKHAFRNTLLPLVTVLGLQLGGLLAGTIVTETVFAWPGVGSIIVHAIFARDYPVIQAAVLFLSVVFVLVNILVDIMYAYIDPRIRY